MRALANQHSCGRPREAKPNRRAFLRYGVTASALAAFQLTTHFLSARVEAGPPRLFRVIADEASASGAAFAAEAGSRGIPVHLVGNDVGSVWMNHIEPSWRHAPATIAGLTTGAALFCLEYLAADYGMGVAYRIEHIPIGNGPVHHVITGPENSRIWKTRLSVAGPDWGTVAASMAITYPATVESMPRIALLDLADRSRGASLFSWLLVPCGGGSFRDEGCQNSVHGAERRG
jgi:hypothetical protein